MPKTRINTGLQTTQKPLALKSHLILCVLAATFCASCATEKYTPKPISVEETTSKLLAKDVGNPDFKAYLINQGYQADIAAWGLDELTLCALYFNPKLDVAKAELGLANAQIESAGLKPNPALSGNIAKSDQANKDIRPWAYGLSVEIPIETANKRELRVEEAQANAAASRMDIASAAWQLRSQIAKDLIEYHQNVANIQLLQNALATHTEIANMLQQRVDKGLAAKTELSATQLIQLKTQSELGHLQAKSSEIQAKLASDVGLSLEKFKQLPLKSLDIDSTLSQQTSAIDANFVNKNLQESALLNRIDIRRALAKYAAAEAKIKLEIAKQTPDISLSPGFLFEFGDSIWSLGFSSLMNLLNKNPTLSNEAKQLREIEGAQFEALQAQIIGDLNQAYASFTSAQQNFNQAQSQYTSQLQHIQKLQKQLDAGLIDRLEFKQATINNNLAQQQVVSAQFELLKAADKIEDVMQAPIYSTFAMPN